MLCFGVSIKSVFMICYDFLLFHSPVDPQCAKAHLQCKLLRILGSALVTTSDRVLADFFQDSLLLDTFLLMTHHEEAMIKAASLKIIATVSLRVHYRTCFKNDQR